MPHCGNKKTFVESYIRDIGDFFAKLKTAGEVPKGAILVIADVVGLYPSIPQSKALNILKKSMKIILIKKVSTEDMVKWLTLFLKTTCLSSIQNNF